MPFHRLAARFGTRAVAPARATYVDLWAGRKTIRRIAWFGCAGAFIGAAVGIVALSSLYPAADGRIIGEGFAVLVALAIAMAGCR